MGRLSATVKTARIREDQEYEGIRVTLVATLERARIDLQVDVGFGDVVTPAAVEATMPTLLDFPAPVVRTYPRETVISEKLQAMVDLGMANSRMKDFFDVYFLAQPGIARAKRVNGDTLNLGITMVRSTYVLRT